MMRRSSFLGLTSRYHESRGHDAPRSLEHLKLRTKRVYWIHARMHVTGRPYHLDCHVVPLRSSCRTPSHCKTFKRHGRSHSTFIIFLVTSIQSTRILLFPSPLIFSTEDTLQYQTTLRLWSHTMESYHGIRSCLSNPE